MAPINFDLFRFNGKVSTRGRIASTINKILKRNPERPPPAIFTPKFISVKTIPEGFTEVKRPERVQVISTVPTCQSPMQRRQQIARYLRGKCLTARIAELKNMLHHQDNWWFPVFDTDLKYLRFLISRAKDQLKARQRRNIIRRQKPDPAVQQADMIARIERLTGMTIEIGGSPMDTMESGEEECPPPSQRPKRRSAFKMPRWPREFYKERLSAPRDPHLAYLLRKIILNFRIRPTKTLKGFKKFNSFDDQLIKAVYRPIRTRFAKPLLRAQHQGVDEDAHGSETQVQDQASNVVLERQTEESEGIASTVNTDLSFNLSTNDPQAQYDAFLDRFIHVKTLEWNSSKMQGDFLFDEYFPLFFLKNRENSPNASFFKLFQYWKGDMEFKIQINSNPFQVGQLQCSWRYMDAANKNIDWYKNVNSLSQTTHALISANSNNAARIYVPYRYVKSSIPTTIRSDQDICLNMGALRIAVLNKLHATSSSYHACDVSIWVRFLNGKFSGMKAADVGKHEGLLDDIKQAELHVNIDGKIDNTDKPPVQSAKNPVVVASNQSFCLGTQTTEPLNALRLDARGQCNNVEGLSSETKISSIARMFGFVKTFTWASKDTSTKLLTTIDASPMFNLNEYMQGTSVSDRWYNLPPVAVLSEQFLYWRGSLELRLDIVATDFHRGKLLVCYVPRELGDITYTQALSSPHVVFDLRDNKQFSMIVPWISNVHYWQRRYGIRTDENSISPPGKIHIFIQNRLVPMDNVRDRVDINLYWRGGEDFSVAVPATSALSLPWNALDNKQKVEIRAIPSYYPYYVGAWRRFGVSSPILRYGPGMDHVAQFEGFGDKTDMQYYKYTGSKPLKVVVLRPDTTGTMTSSLVEMKFAVRYSLEGYNYLAMSDQEDDVKNYLNYQHYPTYKKEPYMALPQVNDDDKGSFGGQDNLPWEIIDYTPQPPEPTDDPSGYYVVEHNGDERQTLDAPSADLVYNKFFESGENVFGENFTDLKDVCRRYQPYCSLTFSETKDMLIDALVPVQPWGHPIGTLIATDKRKLYEIYNREGIIPIICSAFQFYRGSIRYRLVLQLPKAIGNFCVVHFPERHDVLEKKESLTSPFDRVFNSNYGYYIQSAQVNNVIEFEVPYYLPYNSIFCNPINSSKTEFSNVGNLGTIALGLSASVASTGTLFYSLGDDAQFSCFQGWPSLILRSQSLPQTAQHQGIKDWIIPKKALHVKVDLGLEEVFQMPEIVELQKLLKDVATTTVEDLLCQIGHMLLNPQPKTIAWSIVSILINLKIFKMRYLTQCMIPFEKLADFFSYTWSFGSKPDTPHDQKANVSHQGPEEDTFEFWGEIVAFILEALGMCLSLKIPTNISKGNYANIFRGFFSSFSSTARTHNRVVQFIVSCVKMVQKLIRIVTLWIHPELALEVLAQEDMPTLRLWTLEAHELLNVQNEEKIYTKGSPWSARLEVCYMLGTRIYQNAVKYDGSKLDKQLFVPFYNLFKQICDKRDQMFRRGVSVVSRKDPYCIYLCGRPGIGKSVLATALATRLVKDCNIPVTGEPIFTLPNGAKHWNGCRNQPVILIDDFLSVNSGTIQEEAIRAFMEIKSPAVLNPPMAHLQDKELRYAPEILLVLSNEHFPTVMHSNLEAIYRRRDILVDVELCDEMQAAGLKRISDMTIPEIENTYNVVVSKFGHLDFSIAGDVTGGQTESESASHEKAQWSERYSFGDFYSRLLRRVLDHRENQAILYEQRLEELHELLEEDIEVDGTLSDKLAEYQRLIEVLGIIQPKEHCDFKEYLYLVQQAANGLPISEERLERLAEMTPKATERFKAFQAKIQEEEIDHQGPSDGKGAKPKDKKKAPPPDKQPSFFTRSYNRFKEEASDIKNRFNAKVEEEKAKNAELDEKLAEEKRKKDLKKLNKKVEKKSEPPPEIPSTSADTTPKADETPSWRTKIGFRPKPHPDSILTNKQKIFDIDANPELASASLDYLLSDGYARYKKLYTVKIKDENCPNAVPVKFDMETIYEANIVQERLDKVLEHHNLRAMVTTDVVGEDRVVTIKIPSIENASKTNKDTLEGNAYYNVLHAVCKKGDFRYGCKQYDKMCEWIEGLFRMIANTQVGDEEKKNICLRIIRNLLRNSASSGNATSYRICNEIVAQLHTNVDLQKEFCKYIGNFKSMDTEKVMGIILIFALIVCMRFLTFEKMREIAETIDAEAGDIPYFDLRAIYDNIIMALDKNFPPGEMKKFDLRSLIVDLGGVHSPVIIYCPHYNFNPMSSFQNGKWTNRVRTGSDIKLEEFKDDLECTAKTCPWKCDFWYRTTMNWWKKCNPSQVLRINKLPEAERPKAFKKETNTDYSWCEKVWAIIKDVGRVLLEIIKLVCAVLLVAFQIILILLPLLCKIWLIYKVYQYCTGQNPSGFESPPKAAEEFSEAFHENVYSGKNSMPKASKFAKFNGFFGKGTHESIYEEGNQIIKRVRSQIYFVNAVGDHRKFRVFALGGYKFIFLKHYYEMFKSMQATHLNFSKVHSKEVWTFSFDSLKFLFKPENSCGICTVPKNIPPIKMTVNWFQSYKQYNNMPTNPVFVEYTEDGLVVRSLKMVRKENVAISATQSQSEQILSDVWSYDYGGPGCCGSPILDLTSGTIVAIHVAGIDKKVGFGEIFCRESFLDLYTEKPDPDIDDPVYVKECPIPAQLEGNFDFYGEVETGLELHQSGETQIVPSLIAGVFPQEREPGPLSSKDPRLPPGSSPLFDGVKHMLEVAGPFPSKLVETAKKDLQQHINAYCKPVLPVDTILSYKQAILGIDGLKYYDSLDMSTSEGYPMSRFRPKGESSKSWLFSIPEDRQTIGINKELIKLMKLNMDNRINGMVNPIIHDDCLKDALMPKEKCKISGKTRIFSISPVQFTIQFRQFFTHFLAAFKSSRLSLEHAVGIAPNGPEWGMLLRFITSKKQTKFLCGDYSNFGPTVERSVLYAVGEIMCDWFKFHGCNNATFDRIRRVMIVEVANAFHLCSRFVYRVVGGLPSGNPATVEMNSMANMLYLRVAWLEIMNQGEYRYFLDSFYLHLSPCVYGDDVIIGVSDEVAELFNNESLQKFFARYNIRYTSSDKSNKIVPFVTLESANFLKRGFKPHPKLPNEWLGPLPKEIVCDTANWMKKSSFPEEQTKEVAVACGAEAYSLGPEQHGLIVDKLRDALSHLGIGASLRTWEDWDSIHFSAYWSGSHA